SRAAPTRRRRSAGGSARCRRTGCPRRSASAPCASSSRSVPTLASPAGPWHRDAMANEPSLDAVWTALSGYQHTAALKAAIELDLFTAIGEGTTTVTALAARTGASARGLRILLDWLAAGEYLAHEGGGYALTPTSSAFLDRRSPAFVGSAATFIASATI